MAKIVGIKFNHSGKIYYFDPADVEYKKGEGVVVETARGMEFGKVAIEPKIVDDSEIVQPLKPIIRKANQRDYERVKINEAKVPEALKTVEKKVAEHKLNMKLIDAEFTFDNTRVIFYFTAPGRVDFRELVKDLAAAFHIRIELRQVGIRDETKILGGIAPCGRECCCKGTMTDFKKVTIKMAKMQGLSLNPSKISGLCGRLMCCLAYENDHYAETFKKMPKIGSEVKTPDGSGTVISNNMLKMLVRVKIEKNDGTLLFKEYPLASIKGGKYNKVEDIDDKIDSSDNDGDIKELLDE